MRAPAIAAWATAVAYLATGALFFVDPSRNEPAGTTAYWEILATGPAGRSAFVAAFALTGLFALGALEGVGALLGTGGTGPNRTSAGRTGAGRALAARRSGGRAGGVVSFALVLAYLGYGVNTVSYVRLLGGEAGRAQAWAEGGAEVRAAIESSSLVLDPDGYLTFGAVGVFLLVVNAVAARRRSWRGGLALVGVAAAVASWVAMVGLIVGNDDLLAVAAGVGGVLLGPLWWLGIGYELWTHPLLPVDERPDVEERHGGTQHVTPATEERLQAVDPAGGD